MEPATKRRRNGARLSEAPEGTAAQPRRRAPSMEAATMARLARVLMFGASATLLSVSAYAQTDTRGSIRTSRSANDAAITSRAASTSTSDATSKPARGGSLSGVVSDERGGPLGGAVVSAISPTAIASAVSDQQGRYSIDALPAGEYVVRAHLAGFAASRRESVRVAGSTTVVPLLQLRRIDSVAATTGDATLVTRPIVAAGFQLPQGEATEENGSGKDSHSHTETAWRMRHIKRSILKNDNGSALFTDDDPEIAPENSFFGRALGGAASVASFFADVPFNGEVNLLTTNAFAPGELFGGSGLPRGIAYFAIGSPMLGGDWNVRAAMSEGDLASWIVAGSFVSKGDSSHSYTFGLSYANQEYQGGNPAALAAIRDGNRNAGELYAFDRWAAARWLVLDYGARYARYGYIDENRGFMSPRLGITLEPYKGTRLSTVVVQRMVAPGAEEFLPRALTGPALPPERTFAPFFGDQMRAERARLVDLQVEHDFDGAYVFSVRRFYQNVEDQLVTMFRVAPVGEPRTVGHYYVANVGAFDASGWAFRMSSPPSSRVRAYLDYAVTKARWMSNDEAIAVAAPALLRPETESVHDITTSVQTDIPETATRFYVVYRISSGFTRSDPASRPGFDSRFDVQVNQALPFGVAGTKWEVLVGLRNLFHDPNEPSSVYDELLVVRPPKRVVGGFLVRF